MAWRNWKVHAGRLILVILTVALAGWMAGFPFAALAAAGVAFIAWQIYNLWRLHRWLRNGQGELPEGLGIWADIYHGIHAMASRNRRQEENLSNVISEFQSMANAFPDATLVIDRNDVITWCNHSAENLLQLKSPGDLGRPVTNLIRGPDFSNWLAVQKSVKSPLEMASPRDDKRWLTISAVSFRDDQRLVILRDTTEVHRVEKIRRDFVANISHELRTPLTVIQGYLELLDQHPSGDVNKAIRKMKGQTVQMQALLDDLLELSRLQTGEMGGDEEVVDMAALLMQLKEQAEEVNRGKHDIRFEVEDGLQLIGVASDLESACSNLIVNAIKYTQEPGVVVIRWRRGETGPELEVRDNGIGIPRRDIPRLTERFYRVGSDRAKETGGTGLGLAIVKHVLHAHQADLLIESELGEGSTFTCRFPEKRAHTEARTS
jgi:two-component system phosphate regulon sensor histidine kinase PhoR